MEVIRKWIGQVQTLRVKSVKSQTKKSLLIRQFNFDEAKKKTRNSSKELSIKTTSLNGSTVFEKGGPLVRWETSISKATRAFKIKQILRAKFKKKKPIGHNNFFIAFQKIWKMMEKKCRYFHNNRPELLESSSPFWCYLKESDGNSAHVATASAAVRFPSQNFILFSSFQSRPCFVFPPLSNDPCNKIPLDPVRLHATITICKIFSLQKLSIYSKPFFDFLTEAIRKKRRERTFIMKSVKKTREKRESNENYKTSFDMDLFFVPSKCHRITNELHLQRVWPY